MIIEILDSFPFVLHYTIICKSQFVIIFCQVIQKTHLRYHTSESLWGYFPQNIALACSNNRYTFCTPQTATSLYWSEVGDRVCACK